MTVVKVAADMEAVNPTVATVAMIAGQVMAGLAAVAPNPVAHRRVIWTTKFRSKKALNPRPTAGVFGEIIPASSILLFHHRKQI